MLEDSSQDGRVLALGLLLTGHGGSTGWWWRGCGWGGVPPCRRRADGCNCGSEIRCKRVRLGLGHGKVMTEGHKVKAVAEG